MNEFLKQVGLPSLLAKSVAAAVGLLLIYVGFRVLEQTLPRHFGKADARYRVRKFIVYCGYVSALLFLAMLFEDRLGRLSFAIGIAGAGVAVALQDVLASIAGAFSIGLSKLYAVGDRVQIGDTRGDVIDIGLLRTTVMETGSWVNNDYYNGRIARIPNSAVLKGTVFNYSQGFQFVWDEIKVLFTTASDCQFAREMLLRVAREAVGGYLTEARTAWQVISENYRSASPSLEPTVTLVVNNGALEFAVAYVVNYTKRTAMTDQLFTKIAQEVASSKGRLEWAQPATSAPSKPATLSTVEPQPLSASRGAAQS